MKLLNNTKVLLILILFLGAALRLPFLGQLPTGLTIDEAGQGYSAYSILKTGKDEWGDFLPLNPRGFGDYKPPVFMYLLVPSIALFGLSEFAVRFPSAIAGILTVWVMFFLVRDLFKEKSLGLIASLLLAISPWHVYYSRLGWESNVGLFFFCLGVWLFIKDSNKGNWLVAAVFSFGLSALSYHSFKLLAPLMLFGLVLIFWRQFIKIERKNLIFSGVAGLIFVLILGYGFVFSGASRRAADQSVLKEENLAQLREIQYNNKLPQPWGRVLNNKYEFYLSKLTDNYLGYFSVPFLFGPHRSDGSILNFPGKGLFYIWQLPLLFLGIFFLVKRKEKSGLLLLLWVALAPIPASLTQDYQHAGRAQTLFPAVVIISAVGLKYFFSIINKNLRQLTFLGVGLIVAYSLILRIDDYAFNTFNHPLGGLVQGYSEVIDFVEKYKQQYQKIIFTKANSEPQSFVAFYTKWEPNHFQKQSQNWKEFEDKGFKFLDMMDYKLGKYEFKNIDFHRDRHESDALIVSSEKEMPPLLEPKFTIKDSSRKIIFAIYDTNELSE